MNTTRYSRIVLVTGASRGIGADVAMQLAAPDTHVIVNYREQAERAQAVVDAIRGAGGHATPFAADISDEADAATLIDAIAERFGRLDIVVLGASGGLESGADVGYAMHLNRVAQRRLTRLAMPLMPAGARIVFVTSHQAHFYPDKAVPKGYAAVAAGKRAGETALHLMRSEFARAGIDFTVVSGDIADRSVASRIVSAASTPTPSSVVYIGSADLISA